MNKPIIKFENEEQAEKCLREWQHRLFLDHWIINIELVDDIDGQENVLGQTDYVTVSFDANIRIKKISDDEISNKKCQEKILVHELMHLIILQTDNYETIEALHWNISQHQIMEQMARSLVMAKYDLDIDFFCSK